MKSEIKGLKAAGGKIKGELVFLGGEEITLPDLKPEISGKIMAGRAIGRAALMKAMVLEIAGLVVGKISDELFAEIEQGKSWEIGEACCFKLPLLVVDESLMADLAKLADKKVFLDPENKKLILSE